MHQEDKPPVKFEAKEMILASRFKPVSTSFFLLRLQVLVLPLGTGNDMARALGWGGGYENEDIRKILDGYLLAEPVLMDRLHIKL